MVRMGLPNGNIIPVKRQLKNSSQVWLTNKNKKNKQTTTTKNKLNAVASSWHSEELLGRSQLHVHPAAKIGGNPNWEKYLWSKHNLVKKHRWLQKSMIILNRHSRSYQRAFTEVDMTYAYLKVRQSNKRLVSQWEWGKKETS